jgi:glutamine cyclotransferase
MRFIYVIVGVVWAAFFSACNLSARGPLAAQNPESEQQDMTLQAPARTPLYSYEIVNVYPHDPAAFTQGLVFYQGVLYESTGLNGSSSLRKVELETGRVLQRISIPSQYFAEGLALFNGRLLQLTWQNQQGFVYDLDTFQQLSTFSYTGEGWGLTHDGQSLILSDGSSQLRFLDPHTFQVQRTITVKDRGQAVVRLNELEYVRGEVFANVWYTDRIARINPANGTVTGWIEMNGLLSPQEGARADVLNGIAYDAANNRLFITGKDWPKLFEVRLKAARNDLRK